MSLNNRLSAPKLDPLRSLKKDEMVKYLGIPFGNGDTSSKLAHQLDQKLMTRLQRWQGRARTLLGRRLIVQTEILSILWYFTALASIPIRFINRWQSIVNRYVLYNRVSTGKSGVNIVRKGLAVRPREENGIGVPEVKLIVHRQQFQLMQNFVTAITTHSTDDENVWYRPLLAMIKARYGSYSRPRSTDFLLQDPPTPAGWKATMFPLWWRHIITEWNRIKWSDGDLQHRNRVKTLQWALYCPIWWSKLKDFQVRDSKLILKPIGSGTTKFRGLCRSLAEKNKWCLADFLDVNHQWPTSVEFFTMVCSEVHPILGSKINPQDIFMLYRQLSQVFHHVIPDPQAGGMQTVGITAVPPVFGTGESESTKTRYFPFLRSQDWTKLLQQVPEINHHPMEDLGCPPHRIHQELTNLLLLRGYMLPVVHDVMFRLFIGDLTVGSRLYFLAPLNPTIQQCVRPTCQELETTEHCFLFVFTCNHSGVKYGHSGQVSFEQI